MAGLFGCCAGLTGAGFGVGSWAAIAEAMVQPIIMEQAIRLPALVRLWLRCFRWPCCRHARFTVDLPDLARGC